MPLNLSPEDFRVEVVSPKPKVLQYVPPADLKGLRKAPPPVQKPSDVEQQVDAAELEASMKHLPAAAIQPKKVLRGRVYFARDRHAEQMNVVLPIAGAVFEFPYAPHH
jgi:hypothetical protein